MATSRDISYVILPPLFKRLRVYERVLKQLLLQNKYLVSEVRSLRQRQSRVPDVTKECLAALEWQKGLDADADHKKCSMGFCDDSRECPFRSACEGTAPTPSRVAEVFPPIPTEQLG